MSTFLITFRIHDNATYSERYNSLVERIKKEGPWWGDTTSFFAVSSEKTTHDLIYALYYDTLLSSTTDLLVVVNRDFKSSYYVGNLRDSDIKTLLPEIKSLT
tara:strand:- start:3235 stop:3540 length:306 start_codon:yes stop_codon:yes gene_type:complete